ncbi:MAG: UDP-N-acetylglucosamine 2-epimerase (non-hydrolyzing) [Ilumatobacteraceae bacterium]
MQPSGVVAVVLGTRPELIKLAPVIRALGERAMVVHTGQHYDENMSAVFLDQLGIGRPAHHLTVGGQTRGAQIGEATIAIERLLLDSRPAAVLVQGDTNSGLAGALAANAAGMALAHLEAGLRSFDRRMPEEHNRVVIDALSDLCLAPHPANADLLAAEGIPPERVRVTGSTLREALVPMLPDPTEHAGLLEAAGVEANRYVLSTIHRQENTDDPERLAMVLGELGAAPMRVVLPLHPRTRARVDQFGLRSLLDPLTVIDPLGYREFVGLASSAALLISDSGGVQEEATIVKRPVVIVRRSTERPELLGTFAHLVEPGPELGTTITELLADVDELHASLAALPYPYGGDASERVVAALDELVAT